MDALFYKFIICFLAKLFNCANGFDDQLIHYILCDNLDEILSVRIIQRISQPTGFAYSDGDVVCKRALKSRIIIMMTKFYRFFFFQNGRKSKCENCSSNLRFTSHPSLQFFSSSVKPSSLPSSLTSLLGF